DAMLLLMLIFLAVTHRPGVRRATALFLIVYCLVASITETGLGDASPYLLELVVAASLLAAPAQEIWRRSRLSGAADSSSQAGPPLPGAESGAVAHSGVPRSPQ